MFPRLRSFWPVAVFFACGAAAAGVFNPKTATLKNGMQVVVITNRLAPVVSHQVWYKIGSIDESPGESGNAHFLEHLMFKGTSTKPGGFSKEIALVGGQENAFTSRTLTGYYQNLPKQNLETFMALEADRMTNLVLTDEQVVPERQVVVEERRTRIENNPAALLSEQVDAALFRVSPYGLPVIGWKHEIEKLNTETALRFYKKWYAPNNAILIVTGDITLEELMPLAEKHYGVIPANENLPKRNIPVEPPQTGRRTVVMKDPRANAQILNLAFRAPTLDNAWGLNPEAGELLAQILSGSDSSRLSARLVYNDKIAHVARASYDSMSIHDNSFEIVVQFSADIERERILNAVSEELQRVAKTGVSEDELLKARKKMLIEGVYARDSLALPAQIIGRALTSGYSISDVEEWPGRLERATAADVQKFAAKVFDDAASVVGWLMPGAEPSVEVKGVENERR